MDPFYFIALSQLILIVNQFFNIPAIQFVYEDVKIGGYNYSSEEFLSSSYIYDFKSNTCNKLADLNVARECPACTVFGGKVVVTGGENNWPQLKSVEAYDYHENKRTYLPVMIEKRSYHAAVSMGNKMFVIGGK